MELGGNGVTVNRFSLSLGGYEKCSKIEVGMVSSYSVNRYIGRESAYQYRRRRRQGFNPWVGKIPWSRNWQTILENPMDRGTWQALVHGVTKSQKCLSN